MSRLNTRERGAPCWAHTACETCLAATCTDCADVVDVCCEGEAA